MSNPRWEQIKSLFSAAMDLPPAERAAFLDQSCGDDKVLRAEIESLLSKRTVDVVRTGGAFSNAPTATSAFAPITERPGSVIGQYKLLQQIGEGGFGTVFLAEQSKPVRRRVALKIIKLGMDTKSVIARFEAERQALALMEHPHIARVLDAGATDTGRPYFVMEYVIGDSITHFADAHKLDVRKRLELFSQVCQAVQHAHTKGVIHRDIKPGNILVSMSDGKPFAKVIDFGIAKATAAPLTDKTLFTEHRQLIGTPEYMSPEQAEGSADIDTRTDVYALGVLLYELLTGLTPFDGARLRSAAWIEMQRIIREEDPPAPSIRLTRDLNKLAATAAARHSLPSNLSTQIKGELDWIVMKALDKDRARRYESPNQLAADVQRHLAGEAVIAAPVSKAYRLRKFVRRNKGAAISTGAVLFSLTAGMSIAGWAWIETNRAYDDKTKAYEDLKTHTETMMVSTADLLNTTVPVSPGETATVSTPIDGDRRLHIVRKASPSSPDVTTRLFVGTHQELSDRLNTLLSQPQEYVEPSRVAMALSQEVRSATARLRDRTTEAEWSAYTANISLAQMATQNGNWREAHDRINHCAESKRGWEWHLLAGQTSQISKAFPGRGSFTSSFSKDGSRVVTASNFGQIYVWNTFSSDRLFEAEEAIDASGCMTISPDGLWILATSSNGTTRLWDVNRKMMVFKKDERHLQSPSPAFGPDGSRMLALTRDHLAKLSSVRDGHDIATVSDVNAFDLNLAFNRNDSRIVLSQASGSAVILDATTGDKICELKDENKRIHFAIFSPDGSQIATSFHDNSMTIWDGTSYQPIRTFVGHRDLVDSISFSQDGRLIVTKSHDSTVRIWDSSTGTCRTTLPCDPYSYIAPQFSPDGQLLLTANSSEMGGDGTIWIWSIVTGEPQLTLGGNGNFLLNAAFTPDGKNVAMSVASGTMDGPPFLLFCRLDEGSSHERMVEFSLKQKLVLATLLKLESSQSISSSSTSILTPDGARRITGHEDGSVRFTENTSGRELAVFRMPSRIEALHISTDGLILAISLGDDSARVWDIRDPEERRKDMQTKWAERTPATAYLDTLWNDVITAPDGTITPRITADKLRDTIIADNSLSPLRRLVAVELLEERQADLQVVAENAMAALTKDQTNPAAVQAAARAIDLPPRVKEEVLAKAAAWTYTAPRSPLEKELAESKKAVELTQAQLKEKVEQLEVEVKRATLAESDAKLVNALNHGSGTSLESVLTEIYSTRSRILGPGEPPTLEAAQCLFLMSSDSDHGIGRDYPEALRLLGKAIDDYYIAGGQPTWKSIRLEAGIAFDAYQFEQRRAEAKTRLSRVEAGLTKLLANPVWPELEDEMRLPGIDSFDSWRRSVLGWDTPRNISDDFINLWCDKNVRTLMSGFHSWYFLIELVNHRDRGYELARAWALRTEQEKFVWSRRSCSQVLSLAEYRLSNYPAALVAATNTVAFETQELKGPHPATLAILAMTHFKLGGEPHLTQARAALTQLRTLMSDPANAETWAQNPDAQSLLKEAEALIDPK